jgi:release factor glutamine methyltransferase
VTSADALLECKCPEPLGHRAKAVGVGDTDPPRTDQGCCHGDQVTVVVQSCGGGHCAHPKTVRAQFAGRELPAQEATETSGTGPFQYLGPGYSNPMTHQVRAVGGETADSVGFGDAAGLPRVWRTPGVYRPQEDTWMLASALTASVTPEAKVLDFCCGTGVLAIAAVQAGAAEVTAVDCSSLATGVVWANARGRGLPIRVRRGGLTVAASEGPFDIVVSNPPYVPSTPAKLVGPAGHSRRWDGGHDGRAVLGPLCAASFGLLRPGGALFLVQSAVSGVELTLGE